MSDDSKYEPLTEEELEAQHAEEVPEREAMSVLRVPWLGPGLPVEPPEAPPPDE